jgi:hypothetical protein
MAILKKAKLALDFSIYKSENGPARLASYLCLSEQVDQATIWALPDDKPMTGLPLTELQGTITLD